MIRSIFGRGKKKRLSQESRQNHDESIKAAKVGDVLTIKGLSLELDDLYFFIERIHKYTSGSDVWYELVCQDGDNQIWVDWIDGYELLVSATSDSTTLSLSSLGLDEEDLITLDEENSIDNYIEVDDDTYYYKNSSEVMFYQDGRGNGAEFYHWEFMRADGGRILSISKWESRPFEASFTEVLASGNINLYKGDNNGSHIS